MRYDLRKLAKQFAPRTSRYFEPYSIGPRLPTLHLRTCNGVTHAGWQDVRTTDDNDTRTSCGLALHHCDLSRCRHANRHRGRTFSKLVPLEATEVDCMACVAASLGLEDG